MNHSLSFYHKIIYTLLLLSCFNCACTNDAPKIEITIDRTPVITPDYSEITIPSNIGPLNFKIDEEYEKYFVKFFTSEETLLTVWSKDGKIIIPQKRWQNILLKSQGDKYSIEVSAIKNKKWHQFKPLTISVSNDSIDKYLVYRLIEPGFETWGDMGIYQRNLENFTQIPIIENRTTGENCMNCHSFSNNNSETMLFHVRAKHTGTIFWKNSKLFKVDTKTDSTISAGVYPSWHPDDRFVAFSTNRIVQSFHAIPDKKVEVLDTLSDLIIYDTKKNIISSSPDISSPNYFETFPEWAPDGRSLYFCRAKALPPEQYDEIRYDLFKIDFSPESKTFGKLTPVLNFSNNNQSITFPRISPDGKFLLFCVVNYGNFSIWHKESDLFYLNLNTGEVKEAMQLNSNKSESYHSWSQNGRWVVFSSRRQNGLYTQPFISYFDGNGNFTKPFILPQKSPDFYTTFLKSYNIPEFVRTKVELSNLDFAKFIISDETIKSKFD